jgi:hypothetical protein
MNDILRRHAKPRSYMGAIQTIACDAHHCGIHPRLYAISGEDLEISDLVRVRG